MRCSTKCTSRCCFLKAVSNNYFQKFLLINFISTCSNWLNNFSFTHFLLIKGYGKYSLWKESVTTLFVEWFKTARESSLWILLVLRAICSIILFFPTFGWYNRLSTGCSPFWSTYSLSENNSKCLYHIMFKRVQGISLGEFSQPIPLIKFPPGGFTSVKSLC